MLALCDRFKVLPSQLLDEDAGLYRLLAIEERGRRRGEGLSLG